MTASVLAADGVVEVELLLAEEGSGVVADTVAVFTKLPLKLDASVPLIVYVRVAPLASAPKLHDTFWLATEHAPPSVPPTVTAVTAAGTASPDVTASASDGPALATVTVQVTAWPGTAGFGVDVVLRIDTSALDVTSVVTLLVQRALAGHVLSPPPPIVAVLVTLAAAAAVGVTGITKLVLAPAARPAATVQVTVWPDAEQPDGSAPIVRPVGIVSLTVDTAVVALVPVLETWSV